MKEFFKRLTAKITQAKQQTPSKKVGKPSSKLNKILVAVIAVLIMLFAAAYFLFETEISATYSSVMQYFGDDAPPVQATHAAPPPPPVKAPISATLPSSAVAATSAVMSTSSASAIMATSDVAAVSAISSVPNAQSSVVQIDPTFDTETPNTTVINTESSVPPSTHRNTAFRPHNRDIRHCLSLKTNEAIARCVYPK
ncbi:MAG: hypothetical protein PHU06_07525 [Gallionella sp.]|nr:hypothetical protein [Gallionella sp.]MDD4959026.1 hypothetical protein [Gallionella sp.]